MAPQPLPTPPPRRFHPIRCLSVAILSLVILLGLIVLIFYLSVRPSPISYFVDDARIRNYNLTSAQLNATFDFSLLAHNPNRHLSIYYDYLSLAVWYSDQQMLAFRELSPFYQPKRNDTRLIVSASASALPLPGSVVDGLKHDRSAQGQVALEVKLRARIRFKLGLAKSHHYVMRIYCAPVIVKFSPHPAVGVFQKTYCNVDI